MEQETVFGKYHILRLLGRGGMGVVYLAEDTTLGREVALKVLDQAITSDRRFAERFREEARLIATLEHPRIVGIHALEQVDGIWCIDMPYLRGGSLFDALTANVLTPAQMVRLCGQALDALACCHQAGVVHRDIKPANILLTETGDAVVSDFGLAKILAEEQAAQLRGGSSSGLFMGTPKYAPPESWDGCGPTPAWDVYSIGMILYEGIAGRPPYTAETPLALMKQMVNCPIPPLGEVTASVSPELSALVAAMLAGEAEARPANASEALDPLRKTPEFAAGTESDAVTVVRRVRKHQRKLQRFRSHRSWPTGVAAALIVTLLLVAGAVFFVARDRIPSHPASPVAFIPTADEWPCELLDISDPESPACIGYLEKQGDVMELAAFDAACLYTMTLRQLSAEQVAVEGFWAQYGDLTGRFFTHGTLRGGGRRMNDVAAISLVLEYTNAQDASRQNHSLLIKQSGSGEDKAQFLSRLASAAGIQPMLYNELLPRHLPWAGVFEQQWLADLAFAVTAPFLPNARMEINGVLEEPVWQGVPSETDADGGLARSGEARLLLRYDEQALYLGISVPKQVSRPVVILSIVNRFLLPVPESDSWRAEFHEGKVTSSQHLMRNRQIPWTCPWEVKTHDGGPACTCEARIPFDKEGAFPMPAAGVRWRLHCTVLDADAPGHAIAAWGIQEDPEPWKGLLVRFGALSDKEPTGT